MLNCGPIAVAALTRRPVCEVEARYRADRERRGNTRRGMTRITNTYVDETLRVLQGYGFTLASEWPRNHGMLYTWHCAHRSGLWLISVGGHFLAKRGRYWWGAGKRARRVLDAVRLSRLKS